MGMCGQAPEKTRPEEVLTYGQHEHKILVLKIQLENSTWGLGAQNTLSSSYQLLIITKQSQKGMAGVGGWGSKKQTQWIENA